MSEEKDPIEARAEAVEKKREERRIAYNAARRAQEVIDLEALDKLEEENGFGAIVKLKCEPWVPGLPTFLAIRSPGGTSYYTRYKGQAQKAKGNPHLLSNAQEMLGESSIAYPDEEAKDLRAAIYQQFPGTKLSAGRAALSMSELEAEDEKKG